MTQPITDQDRALAAGYVLGDLTADELTLFEQQLQQNSDLQAEVDALEASLRLLPQALPVIQPPPLLQAKIMAAIAQASPEVQVVATPQALPITESALQNSAPTGFAQTEPQFSTRSRIPWGKILAAVSTLIALILGVSNLRLRQDLSIAQADSARLQQELGIAQKASPERIAAILQRPKSRLIALRGKGNTAAGTLLFTPGRWQEVIISLGNLPPLPPEQVYRMWLTLNNGDTLPCGEFKTDEQGAVFVKINPPKTPPKGTKATGVFVTVDAESAPLEPRGQRVLSGTI
jgi:hypothetical protein